MIQKSVWSFCFVTRTKQGLGTGAALQPLKCPVGGSRSCALNMKLPASGGSREQERGLTVEGTWAHTQSALPGC